MTPQNIMGADRATTAGSDLHLTPPPSDGPQPPISEGVSPTAGPEVPVVVRPELAQLIPPPTNEERASLQENLLSGGCRDALVAAEIEGERVLLDGHNRREICEEHGLPYRVVLEPSVGDIESAKNWVLRNQLGRRNLTPENISYLRGLLYLGTKGPRGGDRQAKSHNAALEVAQRCHVDRATVLRDAGYARELDGLATRYGNKVKHAALGGGNLLSKKDVGNLARLGEAAQASAVHQIIDERRPAKTVLGRGSSLAGARDASRSGSKRAAGSAPPSDAGADVAGEDQERLVQHIEQVRIAVGAMVKATSGLEHDARVGANRVPLEMLQLIQSVAELAVGLRGRFEQLAGEPGLAAAYAERARKWLAAMDDEGSRRR